ARREPLHDLEVALRLVHPAIRLVARRRVPHEALAQIAIRVDGVDGFGKLALVPRLEHLKTFTAEIRIDRARARDDHGLVERHEVEPVVRLDRAVTDERKSVAPRCRPDVSLRLESFVVE